MKKYRQILCENGKGQMVLDSWRKIGWVMFKSEELKELKSTLHLKMTNIGILLSAAQL
jgi:hypothetical protein